MIPRCPTHGARRRTSRGRPRFPVLDGARPSSGTIISSSRRRSATARSRRRRPDSTTNTTTSRHRPPQHWMVYDIEFKTGKIRWQRELKNGEPPLLRHVKNSYASETAVTDGERVYVYFGSLGLVTALDFKGNVVWSKDLGAFNTQVELGTGASPALYKDRLIVVQDNTTKSKIIAFDKRSGKEIWNVDRDETGNWSTPLVWENECARRSSRRGREGSARTISTASSSGNCAACPS